MENNGLVNGTVLIFLHRNSDCCLNWYPSTNIEKRGSNIKTDFLWNWYTLNQHVKAKFKEIPFFASREIGKKVFKNVPFFRFHYWTTLSNKIMMLSVSLSYRTHICMPTFEKTQGITGRAYVQQLRIYPKRLQDAHHYVRQHTKWPKTEELEETRGITGRASLRQHSRRPKGLQDAHLYDNIRGDPRDYRTRICMPTFKETQGITWRAPVCQHSRRPRGLQDAHLYIFIGGGATAPRCFFNIQGDPRDYMTRTCMPTFKETQGITWRAPVCQHSRRPKGLQDAHLYANIRGDPRDYRTRICTPTFKETQGITGRASVWQHSRRPKGLQDAHLYDNIRGDPRDYRTRTCTPTFKETQGITGRASVYIRQHSRRPEGFGSRHSVSPEDSDDITGANV